ncbi:stage IV sporulation protein A [Tissierella creatinini]|nr:stage IV sporulation protein A [Tissierella creatinini]TJX69222.1 stage IV sporulation protein A [Soehngenia saccharolytica]
MEAFDIYRDISERTDGDIYAGIVGPVRTGKSTFIKRFMELLVLPNMENSHKKERTKDELPLSGSGKTIMTTEPKFVPNEAVELVLKDSLKLKVRMVDCVGYLVKGALGHEENQMPRMVTTPWDDKAIPFEEAAEIGTKKVIKDHSTIGFVITTDGSITDIDRANYIKAEERVINELKEIEKPFVIILNSKHPNLDSTIALKDSLETKYGVSVVAMDCLNMDAYDVERVFEKLLYEFPVKEVNINLPGWIDGLLRDHWIRTSIMNSLKESIMYMEKLNQVHDSLIPLMDVDIIEDVNLREIKLGEGVVNADIILEEGLFYRILNEITGYKIEGDHQILNLVGRLSETKKKYDKIEKALVEAREIGYGLVSPTQDELELEEPEIFKQGNRFGVKLKATAPSLHVLRANITTEISPLIGSEKQSEDMLEYFMSEFENEPSKIWQSNLFGKSLYDLVNEQLNSKITTMPDDARQKLRRALERILNDGSGGFICIII